MEISGSHLYGTVSYDSVTETVSSCLSEIYSVDKTYWHKIRRKIAMPVLAIQSNFLHFLFFLPILNGELLTHCGPNDC